MQHWSPEGHLVEQTSVYGERRVSETPAIDHELKPTREGLANADAVEPEPVMPQPPNPRGLEPNQ